MVPKARKTAAAAKTFLTFLVLAFLSSPAFSACTSDSDCPGGESCSPTFDQCYLSDFAYTQPPLVRVPLGERKTFSVLLASPLPEIREIRLSFSGEGRYFTKFVGGTPSISVIVSQNETRKIPIVFLGGAIGAYSVCINAEDALLAEVNNTHPNSKACTSFLVEANKKGVFTVSTPSIGFGGILLLGIVGGLIYSTEKRGRRRE
ncbi:MAG: hypothetical protein V1820_06315 [archaeon]